MERKAQGEDWF